jgi:Flp pilus assembly pilin Flp
VHRHTAPLRRLWTDRRAATSLEFRLLAGFVLVILLGGFLQIMNALLGMFLVLVRIVGAA